MPNPEDLQSLAGLLRGEIEAANLPADRARELLLKGIVTELEQTAMRKPPGAQAPNVQPVQGAAGELETNVSLSAIEMLRETAAAHALESVREQAFQALLRLGQQRVLPAIDALYRLAVENDLLAARQVIIARGWQPEKRSLRSLFDWILGSETGQPFPEDQLPLLTRAYFEDASPLLRRRLIATAPQNKAEHWARIITAVEAGDQMALDELVERFPSFRPVERDIALQELERLASATAGSTAAVTGQAAQAVLTRLFLRHDESRARDIVLAKGYLPQDAEERALLFFLAEDWQNYETVDYDHSLLSAAYERAGRSMRRRLLEHSRYTGQTDWLRGLSGSGEPRLLNDLSDADWEVVMERLAESERPAELWRLAQSAPPFWSAAILAQLSKRGWRPEQDAEEQAVFERLAKLALESLKNPLPVRPNKSLHAPLTEITCLAMHPGGRYMAAGSSDQRIYQWSLPEGKLIEPPLLGPAPVTRALAYNPDGDLLACASGDNRIRVFQARTGLLVKTFEGHQAMIRGLAVHPDGRSLFSISFDGSARFWRFPHGAERKSLRPGAGELFSLAVANEGANILACGADGVVYVWTYPEGASARELAGHFGTVTHLAANLNGELAASAGRDGMIRIWNFTSGGLLRTIPAAGTLTSLIMHPNEQVLIGGASDGTITLWNLTTGRIIEKLTGHRKPVIGLALSPDGYRLYSADSGATQFASLHVWDLQLFLAIRLSGEITRPGVAPMLQAQLKNASLNPAEKTWLEFSAELALWRQRYDIELGEMSSIHIGEFDIELG